MTITVQSKKHLVFLLLQLVLVYSFLKNNVVKVAYKGISKSSLNNWKNDLEPTSMSQLQKSQVQRGINRFGGMASLAIALGFAGNTKADSLSEANTKLAEYGFPPILFVPSGFSPVVSEFGRGGLTTEMKNPILVQFASPNLWVVQKTSVNNNGEAGTISTNGKLALRFCRARSN